MRPGERAAADVSRRVRRAQHAEPLQRQYAENEAGGQKKLATFYFGDACAG